MEAQQPPEQRWQQILTILDEVFELPTEEHLTFLHQACGSNPDLYRQVEALLKAESDAPTFLDRPALELMQSFLSTGASYHQAQIPDYTDRCIGPYRLCDEIGRGGMGVVYRAERTEGSFDQQVAIKLLSNWENREMRLDRFQREQQLLASLNHPNIAQLYDGGLTEEGQPYIVMEYVRGEPINHYCDQHQLSIDARLNLAMQVVDALHYAHRNLVIHRDIKPSNILVTEDGQVKLLDFGIAKLLDDETRPAAIDLTQTGEQLMTPGFAAPEQLRGQIVSVATDIFQLGLVLYELLTGRHAFREQAGSFYELARSICEGTPTRPSLIVNQQVENRDGRAQQDSLKQPPGTLSPLRGERLTQWSKKLRGDLDAILLKALRNEPEMRYSSMEALGADIQAYFEARPVAAREKGVRYRLGKFVRRNTLAVIAGASIGALLIAYAATVTVQANRIHSALEQSRVEAHKAQQVSDFIIDIFKVSDPNVSGIETVTVRELLDRSQERIHDQLEDAPEIQAQMLHVLGEIYYSLGSYKESAVLQESALQIRRRLPPKQNLALASTLTQLAFSYNSTDKYDEAQKLLEEALAIHRAIGIESVEQAEILNALGEAQRLQANHEQAEALYREAIAILRQVTNGDHSELATGLHGLAMLQRLQGDAAKAEANSREAVEIFRTVLGESHSYYTVGLNGLGLLLAYLERYEEAEPLHLRALNIQERILGKEHPYVAHTLRYLGFLAYRQRQLEAAEGYYRRALSVQKKIDGGESATVALALSGLGTVLTQRGEYEEAESVFAAMLEMDRAIFSPDSPTIGRDLSNRAALAHAMGELEKARADYEHALEILPPNGTRTAVAQEGYAQVLLQLDELESAKQFARAALQSRESELPPGHSLVAEAQSTLGAVLARMGSTAEAMRLLTRADEVLRRHRDADDVFVRQVRDALRHIEQRPHL
ncbi:MAG: tetratricopeptide repeat protein [Pseudomonadales bacterium]